MKRQRIVRLLITVIVLSCIFFTVPVSAEGTAAPLISNYQDLLLTSGSGTCGNGTHGEHQTRICHTSHGTYAAYLTATYDGSPGTNEFVIVKIADGTSSVIYRDFLPLDSSSVNIMCDENEEVYVAAIPGNKYNNDATVENAWLAIYHVDAATDFVSGYQTILPFDRTAGFGYSMPIIDTAAHKIYAMFSGADAPGYFSWFIFDLATKQWEPTVRTIEVDYRHCYTYAFADGNGGVIMVAERDITKTAAGHPEIGFADYVWDDLCLFTIPDMYATDYTQTHIADPDYSIAYMNIRNNSSSGDTYLDADGLLHVLYTIREYTPGTYEEGGNTTLSRTLYHAIYNGQTCLSNEQIQFARHTDIDEYCMRMAQATDGTLYIAAIENRPDTAILELWKATDAQGSAFELYSSEVLTGLTGANSLILSTPRNQSAQDDQLDCLFLDSTGSDNFHYFRLSLPLAANVTPTDSSSTTTAGTTVTDANATSQPAADQTTSSSDLSGSDVTKTGETAQGIWLGIALVLLALALSLTLILNKKHRASAKLD